MLTNDRKHLLLMNPVEKHSIYNKYVKTGSSNLFTISKETVKKIGEVDVEDNIDMEEYLYESLKAINSSHHTNKTSYYEWDGIPDKITPTENKFLANLYFLCAKLKNKIVENKQVSVDQLFMSVKESIKDLVKNDISNEEIKNIIEECDKVPQYELKRSIIKSFEIVKCENILYESKFTKYIEESELLKFILGSKRGLCSTYLHNFRYHIPNHVAESFKKAEELKVFDNYLIIYHDPSKALNPFYTKVNQEKKNKREKDPILFGLIESSTKLYFIDDWIDDYCDLTFDKLVSKVVTGTLKQQ